MANVFEDLKRKVSIEQVASQLGYNVNPRAGTRGSYLEMQLYAGDQKADTIVIRKGKNGKTDSFFHRGNGKGGSVIDFVQENLRSLDYNPDDGWKAVFGAFSRFTQLSDDEFHLDARIQEWRNTNIPEGFNAERFDVQPLSANPEAARLIYGQRALSDETIQAFEPWIRLLRDTHSDFKHPSLAFPYREPGKDEIVGYELHGYGKFKGMAAGTNATTAAWIVDKVASGDPDDARKIYFAESAYDILALWQRTHLMQPDDQSVYVSVGGPALPASGHRYHALLPTGHRRRLLR